MSGSTTPPAYAAARRGAAVVRRQGLFLAEAAGKDRVRFLQGMLSNDVSKLAPGEATPAAFLDNKGRVVAFVTVLALKDRFFLEFGAARNPIPRLERYVVSEDVAVRDVTPAFAVLTFVGPKAGEVLGTGAGLWKHEEVELAGSRFRICRTDEFGLPTWQAYVADASDRVVVDSVRGAGVPELDLGAFESIRVESGAVDPVRDVSADTLLPETGREDRVSYEKGCYLGQETVSRIKHLGGIRKRLAGLILDGGQVPPSGAVVTSGGREVGRLTTAAHSYALGRPVALAYLKTECLDPGTQVEAGPVKGTVAALPLA